MRTLLFGYATAIFCSWFCLNWGWDWLRLSLVCASTLSYRNFNSFYFILRPYFYVCTGCARENMPFLRRMFVVLNYFDITQNTCIQSWTITQIKFKKSELLTYLFIYLFIYYQVLVKTPLHNTWLMFESQRSQMRYTLTSFKKIIFSVPSTLLAWTGPNMAWLLVKDSPMLCMCNTC
jgi:hypothetical protein